MVQSTDSRELPPIWRAWIDSHKYQERIRKPAFDAFHHCVKEHLLCNKLGSELPKRLLDLTNQGTEDTDLIKLVETDQIEMDEVRSPRGIKYAALSYCWGSGVAFKTTPGNLDKHLTTGLKVSDMPRTLSDAVRVARDLHIQYLWIDALCILQHQESDSKALQVEAQNDWTHESVRMHAIYGNAWLTIVAAGAAQCDEGLYMMNPHISKLGDQPIFSRAWTLQEWLVSKRLLVFATEAVYYACSKSTPDPDKLGRFDCLRVTLEQLKLRASPVTSDDASYKHDYWLRIIVNFSCRVLSSRPDKLPAFSGVAQKIFSDMGLSNADYLAGLCRGETLIKDLTWAVYRLDYESPSRYHGQRPGRLNMFMFRDEKNRRSTSFKTSRAPGRAPSWSWASMDGVVEFGIYARTQDLATVLSCETRPAEEGNYFGQITSGTLILDCSCYMKVLSYEYGPTDFRLRLWDENNILCILHADDPSELYQWAFSRDEDRLLPKEKELYCLGLYKDVDRDPEFSGIYGIVVGFDNDSDAYVRLGMAYWMKGTPNACETKSFKIV